MTSPQHQRQNEENIGTSTHRMMMASDNAAASGHGGTTSTTGTTKLPFSASCHDAPSSSSYSASLSHPLSWGSRSGPQSSQRPPLDVSPIQPIRPPLDVQPIQPIRESSADYSSCHDAPVLSSFSLSSSHPLAWCSHSWPSSSHRPALDHSMDASPNRPIREASADYSVSLVSLDGNQPHDNNHGDYNPTSVEEQHGERRPLLSFPIIMAQTDTADNEATAQEEWKEAGIQRGNSFQATYNQNNHHNHTSSSLNHSTITTASTIITPEFRRLRYEQRKQIFACTLAFLSGFADVLCRHSFGCYGNMMTGNTITLVDHLAAGRWQEAGFFGILVSSYIVGAGLYTYLSHIDLTVLGWGGPNPGAFAHLNPPRRLRSPQEVSALRVVAVTSLALFLLGEIVVVVVAMMGVPQTTTTADNNHQNHHHSQLHHWRLPFFACAFGLLNAATLAAIHLVTNAVTGHWITVGLGVADDLPILLNKQSYPDDPIATPLSSSPPNSTAINASDGQQQPPPPQQQWKSSISVAGSFIGSIVVTSILYNAHLRHVQNHPQQWYASVLAPIVSSIPMGVVFAFFYTVLLYWYTLPPPYLHGYSSRADLLAL